ncbi:MAG: hypothetical protein Q4C98_10520 [Capnocytophaga sp.]|nr:hypothetical protein [Capnocytophaga sp.]
MTIIAELQKNRLIDDLRQHLIFNESEYLHLITILQTIKADLKGKNHIDKTVAAFLYEIPKMLYIWLFRLKEDTSFSDNDMLEKLENACIEIDTIIGEEIFWADTNAF